jgi:cell wall-associated NlpC family hydrolase
MNSVRLTPLIGAPRLAGAALAIAVAVALAVALVLSAGGARHAPAHSTAFVAEAPDPLASQSYPDPAGAARHARAAAPSVAASQAAASPGAPSLAEVKRELAHERRIQQALSSHVNSPFIDPVGGAFSPPNVIPLQIRQVIAAGNAIADFPYVYGGGHASFIDRAYDCSGSVSYALAAAGLINAPETSGQLEHWGVPGRGRYLTVFANAGHTFMNVDGVWFDTAGRAGPYSTRWLTTTPSLTGYAIRHPAGL